MDQARKSGMTGAQMMGWAGLRGLGTWNSLINSTSASTSTQTLSEWMAAENNDNGGSSRWKRDGDNGIRAARGRHWALIRCAKIRRHQGGALQRWDDRARDLFGSGGPCQH